MTSRRSSSSISLSRPPLSLSMGPMLVGVQDIFHEVIHYINCVTNPYKVPMSLLHLSTRSSQSEKWTPLSIPCNRRGTRIFTDTVYCNAIVILNNHLTEAVNTDYPKQTGTVTWIILWAELAMETAERSIRRKRYFIGQKFNILETVPTVYRIKWTMLVNSWLLKSASLHITATDNRRLRHPVVLISLLCMHV